MSNELYKRFFIKLPLVLSGGTLLFFAMNQSLLASSANLDTNNVWDMLILLVVFAITAASAVLPVAAIRQWGRNWKLVACLPLAGLLIWVVIIMLSRAINPDSHQLWQLEIFAWAMINMIYMVTVMTAKRMFARKDSEESDNS